MEQLWFRQLPWAVRIAIGVAYYTAWVCIEGFIIDRNGLWKYMPYYRKGAATSPINNRYWGRGHLTTSGNSPLRAVTDGQATHRSEAVVVCPLRLHQSTSGLQCEAAVPCYASDVTGLIRA